MTNVIIIHGTCGSPKGNWLPWLKSELEKIGYRVFVPKFPTPKNQSLKNWLKVFKKYNRYLDKDSIVIGHSLGPSFLLSVLEKLNHPIKAAFFVAGFTGLIGRGDFDKLNKTFTTQSFNWVKINKNCKKFFVINSNNDPYIPLEKGKMLAKNLNTKLIILKNAGHINKDSGYVKFDFLLNKIKKYLKK
ncbi:MAG: alpha/beta hydrolase [Patescibacteria group bacterium]|nr:alpha/beta hydrolase [Patescibacteria group bacterium]